MNIDIEECYKKYAPMVFRRCVNILKNEEEALDAAQDVFVKLLRHEKRLHGQFLSSLLYTIATNNCLNRLRQRKRQARYESQACLPQTSEGSGHGQNPNKPGLNEPGSIDPHFNRVEDTMLMDAILENESESTKVICFMYHKDGMTLREIGDVMGLSISGVRKRLLAFNARAKEKLEGEWL